MNPDLIVQQLTVVGLLKEFWPLVTGAAAFAVVYWRFFKR